VLHHSVHPHVQRLTWQHEDVCALDFVDGRIVDRKVDPAAMPAHGAVLARGLFRIMLRRGPLEHGLCVRLFTDLHCRDAAPQHSQQIVQGVESMVLFAFASGYIDDRGRRNVVGGLLPRLVPNGCDYVRPARVRAKRSR
jgi:hypothetical protein